MRVKELQPILAVVPTDHQPESIALPNIAAGDCNSELPDLAFLNDAYLDPKLQPIETSVQLREQSP
jgi:hypothetical protein